MPINALLCQYEPNHNKVFLFLKEQLKNCQNKEELRTKLNEMHKNRVLLRFAKKLELYKWYLPKALYAKPIKKEINELIFHLYQENPPYFLVNELFAEYDTNPKRFFSSIIDNFTVFMLAKAELKKYNSKEEIQSALERGLANTLVSNCYEKTKPKYAPLAAMMEEANLKKIREDVFVVLKAMKEHLSTSS